MALKIKMLICDVTLFIAITFSNVFSTNCEGPGETLAYIPSILFGSGPANADTLKTLLQHSLTDYDIRIRPRLNQSHAVVVNVAFTPNSVVSLDTMEQRLDVLGYFNITWQDELLVWNPSQYGGIEEIHLPLSQVWRPRMVLLKAFHSNNVIGNVKLDKVLVGSPNGSAMAYVNWIPEGIYSVLCELNVKFYPFDIQDCQLKFYVSDESYRTVYLQSDGEVSTADYVENAEWKLLQIKTGMHNKYDTNMIYVTFRLERRAEFTLYTIMVPLLLLSILDVAGFLIPIESGEKISYMVTLFLTFGFFVFILRDGLPHNSLYVSYFLMYLLELSFVSVLSVVYSIAETRVFQSWGDDEFQLFNNTVDVKECPEDRGRSTKSSKSTGANKNTSSKNTTSSSKSIGSSKSINSERMLLESESRQKPSITWCDFLRKLDMVMFAVFSVLVFLLSVFFFATVLNR